MVDSFTELFLKDDRNVMFNVASSTSHNLHYKNGDVSESFVFNKNQIPKTGKEYAGFMIFGLNSRNQPVFNKDYFNISVQSTGGFKMTPMMPINNTKIRYDNAKSYYKK